MYVSGKIVWQVSEDQRGRWRDFPPHLQDPIDDKWLQWNSEDRLGAIDLEYDWHKWNQTTFTSYKICFPEMT